MSIPTEVTYTDLNANLDINLASDRNYAIDLRTPQLVNGAINSIASQMLDQGWTLDGEYLAFTTMHAPALVGSSSTGFSKITANWYGFTLQFYQPPEADPTGGPGLSPGTFIFGIMSSPGDTQSALLGSLIAAMQITCADPFIISGGAGDIITITALPGYGPTLNDKNYTANIIGGYSFAGATKGGGWQLTSLATVEHSPVTVSLRNKDGRSYLSIDTEIDGNPCEEILLEKRHNYISVVSPYMWCLFRRNDGTTYGSGDIYVQYDNYWICAPEMDFDQRNDPDDPLTFAAFVLIRDRDKLNNAVGITAINGAFFEGGFSPFDSDVGISLILLNSMQTAAGALTTTADKYIQIQALIALSPDAGEALQVIGPAWDMYLVTKYFPLDTLAIGHGGKLVIAYRSQQAPCECTLWLALN